MSSAPFFWLFCFFLALNNHQSICCSFRDSCYGIGNWRWIIIVLYQLLVADDEEEEELNSLFACSFLSFFLPCREVLLTPSAFVIVIADAEASWIVLLSFVNCGFRHRHCGCLSFLDHRPQVLDRLRSKHWILLLLCLTT